MSKKKLRTLKHPQLWIGQPNKQLVEVVVLENWGDGPIAARFWIPELKKSLGYGLDSMEYARMARARLKADYGILLEHYSRLLSLTSTYDHYLNKMSLQSVNEPKND